MNQWDAEFEVTEDLARHFISEQFPELSSMSIQRLDSGWDNTVYLVGGKYTFRFPRRKVAVRLIQMEGLLLPKLEEHVTIGCPKPLFYGRESKRYPYPFLGYAFVPGKSPIQLTDEVRALSITRLAAFMRQLHRFSIQTALESGVPKDHRRIRDVAARKEKMMEYLPRLKGQLAKEVYDAIELYLDALHIKHVHTGKDVFLHGDLHFKNVLVDQHGIISGIIDWGDMNIGHPALDLSFAFSFFAPEARRSFLEQYGEVDEDTKRLARLIAVYVNMLILLQAVDERREIEAEESKENIRRVLSD